jgi:pyruvate/2-oxoacid:ferredoxin oxidoreductase alpha subunit
MDGARGLIEAVAGEFGSSFGRHKTAALDVAGNPDADAALVTIGTIGDTALDLLRDGEHLLLVRVHAYRPFPAAQLAAALARVSYVSVIDRVPAFGSLGPLGSDVMSLDLAQARATTDFVCGVGGTDVTPQTLRWALDHTRAGSGRASAPVAIPVGVGQ